MRSRLGSPRSDRAVGRDRWLVYSSGSWRLRLRLRGTAGGDEPTVRSWTLDLEEGAEDLPSLLERLGVRPTGPVDDAPAAGGGLLRCPLASTSGPASLTARVLEGRITSITAFDEAPDWLPEPLP